MNKSGTRAVHPGEVLLKDYIQPMGASVNFIAQSLHIPTSRLSEIVRGRRGISADTALRLQQLFGSEANGWMTLQSQYELQVAFEAAGKDIAAQIKPLES